jgi:hypothetical protein
MLKKGILMKISAERKFSYHKAKERRSERTIVLGGRYYGSYLHIIFIAYTRPFNDLRLVELILFDVAIFHGAFFLLRRIWRSNLPLITTNNLQLLSTSVPAGYSSSKSSPYITWKRTRGDKPVMRTLHQIWPTSQNRVFHLRNAIYRTVDINSVNDVLLKY